MEVLVKILKKLGLYDFAKKSIYKKKKKTEFKRKV